MTGLLTGITFVLWSLNLLGMTAIDNTILGVVALITGILWIVASVGVAVPSVPIHRRGE